VLLSSNDPALAAPVSGDPDVQISILNAGPKGAEWVALECEPSDSNGFGSFVCGQVEACEQAHVSTLTPMPGIDEVTYDNCGSAFYRFTFQMPPRFQRPVLSGRANVDDIAVAFLNGVRITPEMALSDFCPDTGCDRCEAEECVLTWPYGDDFGTADEAIFRPGENELVFGVMVDASDFEPTGVEFQASVTYLPADCFADFNGDGAVDTRDVVAFLNSWNADDAAANCDGNGAIDSRAVICFLNVWAVGCG
jgi:hypothetical protein